MGLFGSSKSSAFPWVPLTSESQLDELIAQSSEKPVVILKHSTSCNISAMVRSRLENNWKPDTERYTPVYLDLLSYRSVSNKIAALSGVRHESPQVIIFKDGEAVYDASHGSISASGLDEQLKND